MSSKPLFLKPRGAIEPVPWEEIAWARQALLMAR